MTPKPIRRPWALLALALAILCTSTGLHAYPLDGYAETGIRRLEGSRLANEGKVKDIKQPPGALLATADVEPRLAGQTFDLPAPDPEFTRRIAATLTGSMSDYGLAVLDLSNPLGVTLSNRVAAVLGD